MPSYCCKYCSAKCQKKHVKYIEKKEQKSNKREARKKRIQSDARQALKDAKMIQDKVAKAEDIDSKQKVIQMINQPKTHFRKTQKPGRA